MRSEALATLLVLVVLVLLGLLLWADHERAAELSPAGSGGDPAAAGVAARLWRYYLERVPAPISSARQPSALSNEAPGGEAIVDSVWDDSIWVGLGAVLRAGPSPQADEVGRVWTLARHEVIERRGSWVRIRTTLDAGPGPGEAWVDLHAPRGSSPPLGDAPLAPSPLPARPADPERLRTALALLGPRVQQHSIGGYLVVHDVDAAAWQELEPFVRAALDDVELLYASRYGVVPIGKPAETVVIFRSEEAYHELQLTEPEIGAARTTGHAAGGLVALFVGERTRLDIGSTLAHEVGHLLARRALGPALPSWLDEGLADDFATAALARRAGGDPYAGWRTVAPGRVEYGGPLAGLALLLRRLGAGRLVPLDELVAMPRETFYAELARDELYQQSQFLVSCLLDHGSSADSGAGFREYLRGIAGGGPVGGQALLDSLDSSWAELELDYRACLLLEGSRAGLGAEPRGRSPAR